MIRATRLNPLITRYEAQYGAHSTETVSLLNRMTVRPDADRRYAIDNLIGSLKGHGIWNKLDALYLFAAHTQQAALLNWRKDAANFSTINSTPFTVDVGFTGDGVGSCMTNTGAAALNAKALDLTTALWVSQVKTVPTTGFCAWWTGWNWAYISAADATKVTWRLCRSVGYNNTVSSRTGLFTISRTNATTSKIYRDGSLLATDSTPYDSAAIYNPDAPVRLFSNSGTSNFTNETVSAAAYGAALNDSEMVLFYTAVNEYMVAVNLAKNLGM